MIEVPSGSERGTGLIGTVAGFTVFLGFLLFAVQLLVNLYATTAVSSVGFDAARRVAGSAPGDVHATVDAERQVRHVLGRAYADIELVWDRRDSNVVRLHVRAENPTFLPSALEGPIPYDTIDRTFTVRVEQPR